MLSSGFFACWYKESGNYLWGFVVLCHLASPLLSFFFSLTGSVYLVLAVLELVEC